MVKREIILTKLTNLLKAAELYTHTHTHTHTSKSLLSFSPLFIFFATAAFGADEDIAAQVQYKEQLVRELKEEIAQIDSEMIRCENAKRGWVAATVVGGVGVAATGTAAIVQGVKINQQKKEKSEIKTEEKK